MAVFPPGIEALMPWNTYQNYILEFTKNMQLLADIIDPYIDNQHRTFVPHSWINTLACTRLQVNQVTTEYNDFIHSWGQQTYMYTCNIKIEDNVASISSWTNVGRCAEGAWSNFTDEQREAIAELFENWNLGSDVVFRDLFPSEYLELQLDYYDAYSQRLAISDIGRYPQDSFVMDVTDINGTANITPVKLWFYPQEFVITEIQPMGEFIDIVGRQITDQHKIVSGMFDCPYQQPLIWCTSDETTVQKYISVNDSDNNYTTTYTTGDGDPFKVYYGDNYVIYVVPDGDKVSYDDIYNVTKNVVVPEIDPTIHVPTYVENKYGPTPPPTPPSPDIESDNQEDSGFYEHAKFTKVYACTNSELEDLYNWMSGGAAGSSGTSPVTVPDNFDPMERIVGLIGYPMKIPVGDPDATTFTFRNAANQTINTGWSTYKFWQVHNTIDFGTVDIPYWEDETNGVPFLDYSSTVEIYVPFCGVVGLDPQSVMGCTLRCKMWIDFLTGDCSAVVYTNYGGAGSQHPVAFVSGNCGCSEVVSANAFGALQGAKAYASHKMSQAILGGVKNLATSVIGGATTGFTRGAAGTGGSAGMKAGAIGGIIGGAMDLGVNLTLQNMDNQYAVQVAKNSLGTTISGDFGQSTSWHYMDRPYIKVTWPTPVSKDLTLYGKTYGVPVHKSEVLSNYTGYTICNNVDVSGIAGATASELATIKQFLETGVYIKEGGEG